MPKKIYLVDGNSFIYRMFFGLPEFSTKDGKIVNAIFGMAKFFVVQLVKENPDYLIFIKDAKGKNFRHELYEDYKATRDRMPDNLRDQIGDIENIIKKMGIDIIEIDGYEADDVIGTLADRLGSLPFSKGTLAGAEVNLVPEEGEGGINYKYEIDILTGDKDLYSLVSENVKIYDTMKKKKFGLEETREKFGVDSSGIIDYLSIVGDKSDNIPGIDGFGPKKAVDLINIIGGIEEIYNIVNQNNLPFSKGVPEEGGGGINKAKEKNIHDFLIKKYGEENTKKIQSCFKGKTFEKLISSKENAFLSKKLATLDLNVSLENFNLENFAFHKDELLNDEVKEIFKSFEFNSLLGEEQKELKTWKDTGLKVQIIDNKDGLDKLLNLILPPSIPPCQEGGSYKEIVIDTETTSLKIMEAELVGISVYLDDNHIYYINVKHNGAKVNNLDLKEFLNNLFILDILIIGHNIKYDLEIIELFLKGNNLDNEEKTTTLPQMTLGI